MRTEDGSIIHRCLSGDSGAFGILVDKYKAGIYAYTYYKLRNFQDAEDATQEVFERAYRNLRSLRRWESFAFWLYRIAANQCRRFFNARSRRPDAQYVEDQGPNFLDKPSLDAYRDSQVDERLQEALDSLSDIYREVLMLHYFGGMTIKDIARAVGVSPTAVGVRLSRARAQIKEEMIAMMDTAFEGQKLQASFTFRIMEAVKRIKIDPMPRMTGLPIAVVDGLIYVIGGVFGDEDVESHALSVVEAYDPATGEWTRKADMPTARYYPAACVVDGRIYVSGGSASWDSPKPLPTVEVYNPATDAWSQTSDMPKGKSHNTASVVAGKMYIIGGTDQGGAGVVDVYDPATDTWTTATRPAAYKSSVVDVYDPATDTWTTAADFPTPRWDLTANVVDGKIYTIGGRPGDGEPLSIVEEYDPGLPGVISSVSPAGKLLETWGQIKKVH